MEYYGAEIIVDLVGSITPLGVEQFSIENDERDKQRRCPAMRVAGHPAERG